MDSLIAMDKKLVNSISRQIYKQFPEFDGKKPKVRRRTSPKSNHSNQKITYLLTYQGTSKVQGGKTINRYVRVVADQNGKIIKTTTSR
jgi:hypothetical protein